MSTGITCYKAEAPEAALLMSYLGFLTILKNRIARSNKPAVLEQGFWDKLLKDIRHEDKWESNVFDATQMTPKFNQQTKAKIRDAVFAVSDNVREQIKYWKNRRNDCAHSKDNEITLAYVEMFWSFLMSNLPKITVEGGMASLILQIGRYFDSNQVPSGKSLSDLVKAIADSVEKAELADFWPAVLEAIDNNTFDWGYEHRVAFILEILKHTSASIKESAIEYLKNNEDIRNATIQLDPMVIQLLNWTPPEIRNFWKTKLGAFNNPLRVLASMLRNELIPHAEHAEAIKLFAAPLKYTTNNDDHTTLAYYGFGNELHQIIFVNNDPGDVYKYWKFLHNHATVVRQYVENYSLQDNVVKIIARELDKDEFHPYGLENELNWLFQHNPTKKAEFLAKLTENGLSIPRYLTSLVDVPAT